MYREKGAGYLLFLTAVMYFLAVLSKEMAVTLPAVCLLYDFTFSRDNLKKIFYRNLKLYCVLSVMAGGFIYYNLVLHYPSLRTEYYGGGIAGNFATVSRVLSRYIQLVFFPVVLTSDYSFNAFHVSKSFLEGPVIQAMFIDILAFFAVLRSFRINRLIFFGGMWFFITLLPVCQIFPHHEIMAEHYLYLPVAGFVILLCPVFMDVFNWNRTLSVTLLVVFLAVLSCRTVVRNTDWKDSMTLWSKVLEVSPQCARAHDNLGTVYFKQKEFKKALYHYRQAVKIRPSHGIFHNNLGMVFGITGDTDNAEKEFRKALSLNRHLAAAYNNLGIVYFNRGGYKKAAWLFYKSARIKPGARVWFNCGVSEFKTGKDDRALGSFKKAIRYNKKFAEAYKWTGSVQDKKGNKDKALEALRKAVVLKPDYAEAYCQMAAICEKTGDMNRALWYFEKAIKVAAEPGFKAKIRNKIKMLNSSQVNGQ
jgi:Tfp pilus assembly protein PilF